MNVPDVYRLREPTTWTSPPDTYSYSSLTNIEECPRRWQLTNSEWGEFSSFPERPHPAAIEGQIIHEALDELNRKLGLLGRPKIGSTEFKEALDRAGFFEHFEERLKEERKRLADHPRSGSAYALRSDPRSLANQAIRMFRSSYQPSATVAKESHPKAAGDDETPVGLVDRLETRGALSEWRISHPDLPFVGVIDLVSKHDDLVKVIDFKTGQVRDTHKKQIMLYALLWWRETALAPDAVVLQYMDDFWDAAVDQEDLEKAEAALKGRIAAAETVLEERPAPARPNENCKYCPVRARCSVGWRDGDLVDGQTIDIELEVVSEPGPFGFVGLTREEDEVEVVHNRAIGRTLDDLTVGAKLRLCGVQVRDDGLQVAPWTEVFRM